MCQTASLDIKPLGIPCMHLKQFALGLNKLFSSIPLFFPLFLVSYTEAMFCSVVFLLSVFLYFYVFSARTIFSPLSYLLPLSATIFAAAIPVLIHLCSFFSFLLVDASQWGKYVQACTDGDPASGGCCLPMLTLPPWRGLRCQCRHSQ